MLTIPGRVGHYTEVLSGMGIRTMEKPLEPDEMRAVCMECLGMAPEVRNALKKLTYM